MQSVTKKFLFEQARTGHCEKVIRKVLLTKNKVGAQVTEAYAQNLISVDITNLVSDIGQITEEIETELHTFVCGDVAITCRNSPASYQKITGTQPEKHEVWQVDSAQRTVYFADTDFFYNNGNGFIEDKNEIRIEILSTINGCTDLITEFDGYIDPLTIKRLTPDTLEFQCKTWDKKLEQINAEEVADATNNPLDKDANGKLTGFYSLAGKYVTGGLPGVKTLSFAMNGYPTSGAGRTLSWNGSNPTSVENLKTPGVDTITLWDKDGQYITLTYSGEDYPVNDTEVQIVIIPDSAGKLQIGWWYENISLDEVVGKLFTKGRVTTQDIKTGKLPDEKGKSEFQYYTQNSYADASMFDCIYYKDDYFIYSNMNFVYKVKRESGSVLTPEKVATISASKRIFKLWYVEGYVWGLVGTIDIGTSKYMVESIYKFDCENLTTIDSWTIATEASGWDVTETCEASAFTIHKETIYFASVFTDINGNNVNVWQFSLATETFALIQGAIGWGTVVLTLPRAMAYALGTFAALYFWTEVTNSKVVVVPMSNPSAYYSLDAMKYQGVNITLPTPGNNERMEYLTSENRFYIGNYQYGGLTKDKMFSFVAPAYLSSLVTIHSYQQGGANRIRGLTKSWRADGKEIISGWNAALTKLLIAEKASITELGTIPFSYTVQGLNGGCYDFDDRYFFGIAYFDATHIIGWEFSPKMLSMIQVADFTGLSVREALNELAKGFLCVWKLPLKTSGWFYFREQPRGTFKLDSNFVWKHTNINEQWSNKYDGVIVTTRDEKEFKKGRFEYNSKKLEMSNNFVDQTRGSHICNWIFNFFSPDRKFIEVDGVYLPQLEPWDFIVLDDEYNSSGSWRKTINTILYKKEINPATNNYRLTLLETYWDYTPAGMDEAKHKDGLKEGIRARNQKLTIEWDTILV